MFTCSDKINCGSPAVPKKKKEVPGTSAASGGAGGVGRGAGVPGPLARGAAPAGSLAAELLAGAHAALLHPGDGCQSRAPGGSQDGGRAGDCQAGGEPVLGGQVSED